MTAAASAQGHERPGHERHGHERPGQAREPAPLTRPAAWRGYLVGGAALLTPLLGLIAPLGLAPLLAVVGLSCLGLLLWERRAPHIWGPLWALFAVLVLWAALSALWAVDPGGSLLRAARLLAESLFGLLLLDAVRSLIPAQRLAVLKALTVGVGLALVLVAVDLVTQGGLFDLIHGQQRMPTSTNRGATTLAILLPLAAWTLYRLGGGARGALAAGGFIGLAVGLLFGLESDSGKLAALLGALVFLGLLALKRWDRLSAGLARAGLALAAGALIAMPLAALTLPPINQLQVWTGAKPSGVHRLIVYRFAADRLTERPVLGWGLDAARALPGGKAKVPLLINPATGLTHEVEVVPLHPHNGALQLWLELGLPGLLLGLGLLGCMAAALRGINGEGRAVVLAVLTAALVPLSLSYGLWQSWWVACLWLAAGLAALARPVAQRVTTAPVAE